MMHLFLVTKKVTEASREFRATFNRRLVVVPAKIEDANSTGKMNQLEEPYVLAHENGGADIVCPNKEDAEHQANTVPKPEVYEHPSIEELSL